MTVLAVMNYKEIEIYGFKYPLSSEKEKEQLMDALLDKLLEINDLEVSPDLVEAETSRMFMEWQHQLKYRSLATGEFVYLSQEELAFQQEKFQAEAYKLVKTKLVLQGIIEAEKLQLSQEELEEEAKQIAVRQDIPLEKVKEPQKKRKY